MTFTKAFFFVDSLHLCWNAYYYGESIEKTQTKKSKDTKLSKAQLVHREDKTSALLSKPGFHDVWWMLWSGTGPLREGLILYTGLLPLNRFPRASAGAGSLEKNRVAADAN